MATAIVPDKKYEEDVYRHKKPVVDTSDINISIGSKILVDNTLYGTIIRESEIFYYVKTIYSEELVEYQKSSILDMVANKKIFLQD